VVTARNSTTGAGSRWFTATGGTVAIRYARNVETRGRTGTLAGTIYGTLRALRTGKFVRVTGRWVCRIEPTANGVP
jgi:hypothetical protein